MIKLGFDAAVTILVSVLVLLILGMWSRERGCRGPQAGSDDDAAKDVRPCPYCRHVCVDDQHKKVMICPVCKSYFDEEVP